LMQFDYKDITFSYNFGSIPVTSNPTSGNQLTVLNRIYYPDTGRGYLFRGYSSYGMINDISVRNNMRADSSGTMSDGVEVAFTKYNFTGTEPLSDAPRYNKRQEWWQEMTDANRNSIPSTAPVEYLYDGRTTANNETTNGVKLPNGLKIVTKINADSTVPKKYGTINSVVYKDTNANPSVVLRQIDYTYNTSLPDGGTQVSSIITSDTRADGLTTKRAKTTFDYGNYGRVTAVNEYDYETSPNSNSFPLLRKTAYQYLDDTNYLNGVNSKLRRLVTKAEVGNGATVFARSAYNYDGYGTTSSNPDFSGVTIPGFKSTSPAGGHDSTNFGTGNSVRGNVTAVKSWTGISPEVTAPARTRQYDVFGNLVEAQVSCCQNKSFTFSSETGYGLVEQVTNGSAGGPQLTTSYTYDIFTGSVQQVTDPDSLITTYEYDSAWRLSKVIPPTDTLSTYITVGFDKDVNNNDQLSYSEKVRYKETDNTIKEITNKSWFNGAGQAIKSGTATSTTPYDLVSIVYDNMGRLAQQSNPYAGDSSGNGTPSNWTINTYDLLSRVASTKLPDNQTVQTAFDGALVTVTDQVSRKRQSEVDGLGRLISVTEQNPATGMLDATDWKTVYGYDVLDNLKTVTQGVQTRTFVYDALSRLIEQTTPEGGTTRFTYKEDFNIVTKRTDARNVETHYKYDELNRLTNIWYTGFGGDDAGNTRPALPTTPYLVAATADVIISYKGTAPGNGQINSLTDGAGTETYSYDSLGRLSSKSRVIDSLTYATNYSYNTAGQLAILIYPSNRQSQVNFDSRGRFNSLTGLDSLSQQVSYVSSAGYSTAGQLTSLNLSNGVAETYSYSTDRLQLTNQTAVKTSTGTTLMNLSYSYSAAAGDSGFSTLAGNSGQLMGITAGSTINAAGRDQAFKYDTLGRLASATGWSAWQRRYDYDRWGNRTGVWNATSGGSQIQTVNMQSGSNNKIANVDGVSYSYDASGNLTSDGTGRSYQYDAEGRMASAVISGVTTNYTYDASNRRVKKATSTTNTHYVWEGSQVIAEYNGSTGALLSEYIYAGSRLVAQVSGSSTSYYHPDRLSSRLITDGSGNWAATQSHLPFGEEWTESGAQSKWKFTTYERDSETGTDYAINRQYGISTGRFLQPDPLHGSITNPQSLNRYAYVKNDPVNSIDPLGLDDKPYDYGTVVVNGGGDPSEYPEEHKSLMNNQLNCATPNSVLKQFKKDFDLQWDQTIDSKEENGSAIFYDNDSKTYPKESLYKLKQGRHVPFRNPSTGNILSMDPAMPDAPGELRDLKDKFRQEGRNMYLLAFFHTHPNYVSGESRSGDPSDDDVNTLKRLNIPLGILKTGKGYSFFTPHSNKGFTEDDPRANDCIWKLK
jgi:RHS repeat-associated protein